MRNEKWKEKVCFAAVAIVKQDNWNYEYLGRKTGS